MEQSESSLIDPELQFLRVLQKNSDHSEMARKNVADVTRDSVVSWLKGAKRTGRGELNLLLIRVRKQDEVDKSLKASGISAMSQTKRSVLSRLIENRTRGRKKL